MGIGLGWKPLAKLRKCRESFHSAEGNIPLEVLSYDSSLFNIRLFYLRISRDFLVPIHMVDFSEQLDAGDEITIPDLVRAPDSLAAVDVSEGSPKVYTLLDYLNHQHR